jgi:hypothetical protein
MPHRTALPMSVMSRSCSQDMRRRSLRATVQRALRLRDRPAHLSS